MSIATPAFFWSLFAWNIFFQPYTFSLYVSLVLRWLSCRQHISGSWFCIHSASCSYFRDKKMASREETHHSFQWECLNPSSWLLDPSSYFFLQHCSSTSSNSQPTCPSSLVKPCGDSSAVPWSLMRPSPPLLPVFVRCSQAERRASGWDSSCIRLIILRDWGPKRKSPV